MKWDVNWKSLSYSINSGEISLVIGNDLSVLRLEKDFISKSVYYDAFVKAGIIDGNYLFINLYKYLPIRLWAIFGKGDLPSPLTINNIVLELQKIDVKENDINKAIKREIISLTDDQIMLEPFRMLARISGFETFITVNIDNFLERAFAAEGKHVNRSFNFSIPAPALDQTYKKDKALASIFNLMGNIEGFNFALTDEQCLEYIFTLQKGNDAIAKELFDSTNQKNTLFVGSSSPDWFMRFFIRIISSEPYRNSSKDKYVACDRMLQDKELLTFLENNGTKVIPITTDQDLNGCKVYKSSIEFIKEVSVKTDEYIKEITPANKMRYKEIVFISYSRDDKSMAERLRNEFEKNGLHVFFDEDTLQTGDRYNEVIRKYIKDCDYFVALISENAIKDKTRYVYEKEWRTAIVLNGFKDHSYIRPFIIDQTAPTDVRIPEEMRNLNISAIPNFDDLGKTVQKFLRENSVTPIT